MRPAPPALHGPRALLRAAVDARRARPGGPRGDAARLSCRSAWISDVHLGTPWSKAGELSGFLRALACETLYVVGDLIDGWKLERTPYWPDAHREVLEELVRHAREGARVVLLTGNHDEELRAGERDYGPLEVRDDCVHDAADGRRWLVVHGDRHDPLTGRRTPVVNLGDLAHASTRLAERAANAGLALVGARRVALARPLRRWMKRAVCGMEGWVERLLAESRARGLDGVVCGHFHEAALEQRGALAYANTGDWVELRSALLERHDGALELVRWRDGAPHLERALPPRGGGAAARASA